MNFMQQKMYWMERLNLCNAIHHFNTDRCKTPALNYVSQYSFHLLFQKCIFDIKRFLHRKQIDPIRNTKLHPFNLMSSA